MTGQPSDEVIITEVRRLNDFFDMNQGFGLVFIFADPSDVLDGFMRRLQSDHGPGHTLFPEANDLTEQALALTYPNQAPSAAYTCFFANRQGTHGEDNRRNLLGRLNERRDQSRAPGHAVPADSAPRVPYPLQGVCTRPLACPSFNPDVPRRRHS